MDKITYKTSGVCSRSIDIEIEDGVIISGPDKLHGGKERTIIVYYVYYR